MFTVLLPVDDEERGLAAAEAVVALPCAAEEIRTVLLNVQKEIDVTGGEGGHVDSEEWYDEDDVPESVFEVREFLEEAGIEVDVMRRHADPAEEITNVAKNLAVDQIVMSGRKKTPVGKVLFGSVTQSVMLSAERPVTVAFR